MRGFLSSLLLFAAPAVGFTRVDVPGMPDYPERDWSMTNFGFPLNFASFQSMQLDADVTEEGGTFKMDAIWSSISALPLQSPAMYMSSFSASGSSKFTASINLALKLAGLQIGFDADVDGSSAFLANTYLDLVEVDNAGTQLSRRSLRSTLANSWSISQASFDDETGIGNLALRLADGDFEVTLSMAVSNKAGALDTGAIITPTSIEAVVQIDNYPYTDPVDGSLILRIVVGSASAFASGSGSMFLDGELKGGQTERLTEGSGDTATYCDFAKTATVDLEVDVNVDVEMSDAKSVDIDGSIGLDLLGPSLSGMLSGLAGGSAGLQLVTVQFPKGAKHIVYDPTFGVGQPPFGGLTGGEIAGIVIGCLATVAVIVAGVMYFRRYKQNQASGEAVNLL